MSISNIDSIVTVNLTVSAASLPSNLQQQAVIVSNGGTQLPAGGTLVLSRAADLTNNLVASSTISNLNWDSGTVTVTLSSPMNLVVGQVIRFRISGAVPAAYNGVYNMTVGAGGTLTYALGSDPGAATQQGVIVPDNGAEVQSLVRAWFGMGSNLPVTVLEVGLSDAAAGVTALQKYIEENPTKYYVYVTPRAWSIAPSFATLAQNQAGNDAMVYFIATATPDNAGSVFGNLGNSKSLLYWVDSQGDIDRGISGAAAVAYAICIENPSASQRMRPLLYRQLPTISAGNWTAAQRALFVQYNANYPDSSAEAALLGTILKGGMVADGRSFNFWYSADWCNIHIHQNLAATIINGSNNNVNPVAYNQDGINRLQLSAQATVDAALAFNVIAQQADVQAVPYATYVRQNPTHYDQQIYNGLSVTAVPQLGFRRVGFSINVTTEFN